MGEERGNLEQHVTAVPRVELEDVEGNGDVPSEARKRYKQYSAWGRKVDELMARKGLTLEDVAHQMRLRGYPVAHTKHALNRAMQRRHHKAITPGMTIVIEVILAGNQGEAWELWQAHRQTGFDAVRDALGVTPTAEDNAEDFGLPQDPAP